MTMIDQVKAIAIAAVENLAAQGNNGNVEAVADAGEEVMQATVSLIQLIITGASAVILYLLNRRAHRLNEQNRLDAWSRMLREFHAAFWNDEQLKRVRAWLACDAAYLRIQPILAKRLRDEPVSEDEYGVLEDIDKFAALLLAYKKMQVASPSHVDVFRRLFDEYWLQRLASGDRGDFRAYIARFFKELCEGFPTERAPLDCAEPNAADVQA